MSWKGLFVIAIYGLFESFVLIPLHGKWLAAHCKKDCYKCKKWNCPKWHKAKIQAVGERAQFNFPRMIEIVSARLKRR